MGRMTLSEDEGLRLHGWRVFRSSTRDRVIPMTSVGMKLSRIRINEALPVGGVDVGFSLSEDERIAIANQHKLDLALARAESASKSLGITKFMHYTVLTTLANPSATEEFDETIDVGTAPFDGFLTEFISSQAFGADLIALAIRSSGGESMFRSFTNYAAGTAQAAVRPDFLSFAAFLGANHEVTMRNLHMPVFAGESILFVARVRGAAAAGQQLPFITLGFESFTLAKAGSAAAVSQFESLAEDQRLAARQLSEDAARLQLQKQKDSAALERAKIDLEIAKLKSQGSPGPTGLQVPGFNQVLSLQTALEQLQSRAAPVPPPKPKPPPPVPEIDGTGMTFVRSWMPSHGQIGYLIPDPPRGGKVTVFDNKYNIWDISGRNIGSGWIQGVNVEADIPPGARISR